MLDLLFAEYGWTKDYVLECLTPVQLEAFVAAILKRQGVSKAEEAIKLRLSVASIFDEESAKSFDTLVAELLGQSPTDKVAPVESLEHLGIGRKES